MAPAKKYNYVYWLHANFTDHSFNTHFCRCKVGR